MSKFAKLDQQDIMVESTLAELNPVEEGWGTLCLALGGMVGSGIGRITGKPGLGGAIVLGSAAAGRYVTIKSSADLKKLFDLNEIKEYVKTECGKILKEEQEKDPSVTPDLPGGLIKWIKKQFTDKKISEMESIMNNGEIKTEVGPYSIYAIGDTDSIGKITVMLYSKAKNNFFVKVLPPPTKEFIAKLKEKY